MVAVVIIGIIPDIFSICYTWHALGPCRAWFVGEQYQRHSQQTYEQRYITFFTVSMLWWESSDGWSAAMDGHRLFRKGGTGKQGGRVAHYVRA